jgi:hypothetical protein
MFLQYKHSAKFCYILSSPRTTTKEYCYIITYVTVLNMKYLMVMVFKALCSVHT